ncbi:MAG: sulfatase-like hydrolase/transferase [Acidobacteria bacterium]|nr:sulfatase-like hydrolase/transferase [Acidobacteriota bacterium]
MASRRLFWAAAWLGFALIILKASHLGIPRASDVAGYLRSLAAISYRDVLFAVSAWAIGRAALALAGDRAVAARLISIAFIGVCSLMCLYGLASMIAFGPLGGFLTYPLLQLVGSVRMMSSSVAVYVTPRVVFGLVAVPLAYIAAVLATVALTPAPRARRTWRTVALWIVLGLWVGVGQYVYATDWGSHYDWRIAENPPWVLVSSLWQVVRGGPTARLSGTFAAADLADFDPIGAHGFAPVRTPRRPPNVILVVLESVAAQWTSVSGGTYESTPTLKAEAAHGVVFDRFYAHVGRSSNSLASILLSVYTKLDFLDYTEEFPRATQTSLAAVLRDRGYRTSFMTSSNMSWAGWDTFIPSHGFSEVRDDRSLPCTARVTSWGLADACVVDGIAQFIAQNPTTPFFVMAWTQQTHHPYEPTPGVPLLDLVREPNIPDEYDLGRYLNVLHETDRHLARLFEAIRRGGLGEDTLVVVVGDHGQAFGFPHDSYMQGQSAYEEDVRVPLLVWFPRRYASATRSPMIGGLVDLAPTIAELAGVPAAADWQGRSLFDPQRAPRAYFYVAQNEFKLGVREEGWKYILDLRTGVEELYDLEHDPSEQHNVASAQRERSARLRQRLAAWTEANRVQYDKLGIRN